MSVKEPLLLELPMPIRTPRLIILPAAPEHVDEFYQGKVESWEQLKEWMSWAQKPPVKEDDERTIREKQADFILRKDLWLLAFTPEGRFVVATGFHKLRWDIPRCEIGYWCRVPDQGKGYVTETVNALTRYAFIVMKMRKVSIHMDVENPRSEAVAKRLNYTYGYDDLGGITKPGHDELRTKRVYSCFDPSVLPPLEVSWG